MRGQTDARQMNMFDALMSDERQEPRFDEAALIDPSTEAWLARRPRTSWSDWLARPLEKRDRVDDLVLQIKRDVTALAGDETFHGPQPGRRFYEDRIAACRAEILAMEDAE